MKRFSNLTLEQKADYLMACSDEEVLAAFENASARLRAGFSITYISLDERQEDYDLAKHELLTRLSLKN